MSRNIEVKARIEGNLNEIIERIQSLADGPPCKFTQSDTFFNCPSGGRLKLRIEEDSPPQLIYYERNDVSTLSIPKLSSYYRTPVSHPNDLKTVLSLSMGGIRGQVDKHRTLFLAGAGQTRIHIDQVNGLEPTIFVELEVKLNNDQTPEEGQIIAADLCRKIGIEDKNHIKGAYMDLLLEKKSQPI